MQGDILLEKELQILHLDPTGSRKRDKDTLSLAFVLETSKSISSVTLLSTRPHLLILWNNAIPDDLAFKSKSLLGSFSFKSPHSFAFLLWWNNCEGHILYHFIEFSRTIGLYLPTKSKIILYFIISVNLALFSKKCHILRNLRLTHFIGC